MSGIFSPGPSGAPRPNEMGSPGRNSEAINAAATIATVVATTYPTIRRRIRRRARRAALARVRVRLFLEVLGTSVIRFSGHLKLSDYGIMSLFFHRYLSNISVLRYLKPIVASSRPVFWKPEAYYLRSHFALD